MSEPGVWLGVDPGEVRIGIAVSDPQGRLAVPVETLPRTADVVVRIVQLARERQVSLIVVGLPVSMSGGEGPAAAGSRAFAAELAAVVAVPVRLVDERLSTVSATAQLRAGGRDTRKGRSVIDQAAAAVILQSALDMREVRGNDVGEPVDPATRGSDD